QGLPVGEEEDLLTSVRAEEDVNKRHRDSGLAGSGCLNDEEFPLPSLYSLEDSLDCLNLVRAVYEFLPDGHVNKGFLRSALEEDSTKRFSTMEPLHHARVFARPVPEPNLEAVGKEDEEILGCLFLDVVAIILSLFLSQNRVFRGLLCLDHCKRLAIRVKQQVVSVRVLALRPMSLVECLVASCVEVRLFRIDLLHDLGSVLGIPTGLLQEDINLPPTGLPFGRIPHRHKATLRTAQFLSAIRCMDKKAYPSDVRLVD